MIGHSNIIPLAGRVRRAGRHHLLLLLIWLAAAGLGYGAFAWADYLLDRELAVEIGQIDSKNMDVARLLGQSVNKTFTQADRILLFMKTAFEAHGTIDPAHLELLRTFRNKAAINQIAMSDAQGNLVFSAVPLDRPINIADREHFQVHIADDAGQVFISSPRVTEATSTQAIFLSRRLNDAGGNFVGIVSVGLDPDYFSDEFHLLALEPERSIVLLRIDGTFLARVPRIESPMQMDYFKTHVAFGLIGQGLNSGVYESPGLGDVPRHGAFQVLPNYPALVLIGFPRSIALQAVTARHALNRSWAAVFSLVLFVTCLAGWWLLRRQQQTDLALTQEQQKVDQYLSQMEKQKVEMELARLDRLSIIGEMAASIGHEVRNPLTTVRGYLQLFQRKQEYSRSASQFALMIEELDRANAIITEFLSLAKNKRLDFAPVSLNTIISNLAPLLQADAIREGKEIMLELDGTPPILVDSNEIRQLVLNLVRNGLDAMKPGGMITLSVASDHTSVVLVVKDTGEGIPPSIYKNLGTPFMTTKENGTGLGLTVCYKIAERHNAKIEVKTGPQGTTFAIRFPRQPE